jgi:hypothetical protein
VGDEGFDGGDLFVAFRALEMLELLMQQQRLLVFEFAFAVVAETLWLLIGCRSGHHSRTTATSSGRGIRMRSLALATHGFSVRRWSTQLTLSMREEEGWKDINFQRRKG